MIHVLENFRRINRDSALRLVKEELKKLTQGLSVNIDMVDLDNHGWACLDFSGADSEVLTETIRRRYGIATTDISKLERGEVTRGIVVDSSSFGYGIYVDICLRSSNRMDALFPLHSMRSQLVDGMKLPGRTISKRYCLQEGFPLEVRVTNVNVDSRKVEVELSDRQVSYFKDWNRFPFDRVILIGCSIDALKEAVDLASLRRDVAGIESQSLTAHVLLCKLGTDAPGVIPQIGPRLKGVSIYAFQPRAKWIRSPTTDER